METYNKWRKMLYDVASRNFEKNASGGRIKKFKNGISIGGYERPYYEHGVCLFNNNIYTEQGYKEHDYISVGDLGPHGTPGSKFRTAYFFDHDMYYNNDKNYLNLYITYCETLCDQYYHQFLFTAEGIKIVFMPEKKKFFMHDGYNIEKMECCYATYRELAENGYELSGPCGFIKFKSYPKDVFASWHVVDRVSLREPFRTYLDKTIPKLVELYKNNEDLYEDAIDEICEKYPQKEK